jgi:hypothetical protein
LRHLRHLTPLPILQDEPLPRDHGYPVRAIAPGHAGARQCKWLHKVIVSDQESQKPWQQKSYRGFAPDRSFEGDLDHWPPARLDQAPIVQEMPVQSLVCNPPQNSVLGMKGATDITVKGVAWSGGGRKIERVDVSIDGGKVRSGGYVLSANRSLVHNLTGSVWMNCTYRPGLHRNSTNPLSNDATATGLGHSFPRLCHYPRKSRLDSPRENRSRLNSHPRL